MASGLENIETVESPFRRFVTTIGVFPTAFTDAMTYYECLAYLVKYMEDTMIPAINENAEAVEELQGLYIQLKSFVDNYFENLDVQEEINNKLDSMVEDGTLQEIITTYIQSNVAWTFDTVADMKSSTNLISGSYAQTLGFHSLNDGGAALYKIRTITDADVIDEATIIALHDNTLVAQLIIGSELHSKQFGLKGDGTTDETLLLNNFYAYDTSVNKTLDAGIYLITTTLYIKGLWRQDSVDAHNNGRIIYSFDHATIKYTGAANGCAVCFYNMFNQNIEGLSIDRTSNANYVDFIGCWHTEISNFDVANLGVHKDISILSGKTYSTESVQHLSFNNGYVKGEFIIDPGTSYTNGIYFDHVNFNATGYNYNVELLGTTSKQQIIFNNCDLSYATNAVFYIPNKQEGVIAASIGRCSVTCKYCYFDTVKPLFYQNNQNNIVFNNYGCFMAQNNIDQLENIKAADYIKNTALSSNTLTGNLLPAMMINCCHNGNLQNGGQMSSTYQIMGSSTTGITKEVIQDNAGVYGYAQRLTFTDSNSSINQYLYSPALPITGPYVVAMRFKKVSGTCDIQLSVGGQHNLYTNDMIPTGEEVIIVNNKALQIINKGTQLEPIVQIRNPQNLVLEVYECMIIPGRMLMSGLPLHGKCETPTP